MILQLRMIPQWGLDQDSMGGGEPAMLQHLILVFQHVVYRGIVHYYNTIMVDTIEWK